MSASLSNKARRPAQGRRINQACRPLFEQILASLTLEFLQNRRVKWIRKKTNK